MKTIKYLSIFVVAILLINCSKDDDSSDAPVGDLETLILGSWKIVSKTLNAEVLELTCTNGLSRTLSFNETNVSRDVDLNDGNGCVTLPLSSTYTIDGNTLLVIAPLGEPNIWTVLSINEETFQYSYIIENNLYTETYQKL